MISVERGQPKELVYQESSKRSVSEGEEVNWQTKYDGDWELTNGFSNTEVIDSLDKSWNKVDEENLFEMVIRVEGKKLEKAHVEKLDCKEDQTLWQWKKRYRI